MFDPETFERRIHTKIEVNPAERGEFGELESLDATVSKDKASESAAEPTVPLNVAIEAPGSEEFFQEFKAAVFLRDPIRIHGLFSEKLRLATEGLEVFRNFYAKSTVIAHIVEMPLRLRPLSESKVLCSGVVRTEDGREYPAEILLAAKDGRWGVTELGFSPEPVDHPLL